MSTSIFVIHNTYIFICIFIYYILYLHLHKFLCIYLYSNAFIYLYIFTYTYIFIYHMSIYTCTYKYFTQKNTFENHFNEENQNQWSREVKKRNATAQCMEFLVLYFYTLMSYLEMRKHGLLFFEDAKTEQPVPHIHGKSEWRMLGRDDLTPWVGANTKDIPEQWGRDKKKLEDFESGRITSTHFKIRSR